MYIAQKCNKIDLLPHSSKKILSPQFLCISQPTGENKVRSEWVQYFSLKSIKCLFPPNFEPKRIKLESNHGNHSAMICFIFGVFCLFVFKVFKWKRGQFGSDVFIFW